MIAREVTHVAAPLGWRPPLATFGLLVSGIRILPWPIVAGAPATLSSARRGSLHAGSRDRSRQSGAAAARPERRPYGTNPKQEGMSDRLRNRCIRPRRRQGCNRTRSAPSNVSAPQLQAAVAPRAFAGDCCAGRCGRPPAAPPRAWRFRIRPADCGASGLARLAPYRGVFMTFTQWRQQGRDASGRRRPRATTVAMLRCRIA